MTSESRQTVTSTARAMIIFLALEFWAAAAAAFTIRSRYCALGHGALQSKRGKAADA
jgi:hypothetical protein